MTEPDNIYSEFSDDCVDLYRIMPLERFLQMLYTMQNVLVRPSSWDDPYEKILSKSAFMKNEHEIGYYDEAQWFAQCWSCNKDSDSLWRAYTRGTNARSVKIKTTSDDLIYSLKNNHDMFFFLYKVVYSRDASGENNVKRELSLSYQFDLEWDGPMLDSIYHKNVFNNDSNVKALSILLAKRREFASENEVRLICYSKRPETKSIFQYPIPDMGCFIKEVVLDPWTPDGIDETVKDIVKRYIPGRSISVRKSDLYQEPIKGVLCDPYHFYDEYIRNKQTAHRTRL